MRLLRNLVLALLATAAGGGALIVWSTGRAAIDPVDPPVPSAFEAELVEHGEALAAIGACAVCHTRPGGAPFAGGLALATPFGTIYSTNITPDPGSGVGRWSRAAFVRAMREGIDRDGGYLYPAFPYDHFTRVTDRDLDALYAFVMTRDPSGDAAPPNALRFPFNIRWLLAAWNLLYLENGVFEPDSSQSEEWNRGAYLVEGLGHCSACHGARTALGAVDRARGFVGGEADGWRAPALDASNPARVPWTVDALVNYLIDGWDAEHGIAAGPMKPIVDQLSRLPEDEIYAIAAYIRARMDGIATVAADDALAFAKAREFTADRQAGDAGAAAAADPAYRRGAAIFEKSCANCHRSGSRLALLGLTTTVNATDPRNLIRITVEGIRPPLGSPERAMPAFGGSFSDDQIADLVYFIRAYFSREPAWPDIGARIDAVRTTG